MIGSLWTQQPATTPAAEDLAQRTGGAGDAPNELAPNWMLGSHCFEKFLRLWGSATFNPADLLTLTQELTTVTVPGAALGDFVIASFSLDLAGIVLTAYVSGADTVTVAFTNGTAGNVNLGSGTIRVCVVKMEA